MCKYVKTTSLLVSLCVINLATAPDPVCDSNACKDTAERMASYMDDTFDPCDDFHRYACGNYTESKFIRGERYPAMRAAQRTLDATVNFLRINDLKRRYKSKAIRRMIDNFQSLNKSFPSRPYSFGILEPFLREYEMAAWRLVSDALKNENITNSRSMKLAKKISEIITAKMFTARTPDVSLVAMEERFFLKLHTYLRVQIGLPKAFFDDTFIDYYLNEIDIEDPNEMARLPPIPPSIIHRNRRKIVWPWIGHGPTYLCEYVHSRVVRNTLQFISLTDVDPVHTIWPILDSRIPQVFNIPVFGKQLANHALAMARTQYRAELTPEQRKQYDNYLGTCWEDQLRTVVEPISGWRLNLFPDDELAQTDLSTLNIAISAFEEAFKAKPVRLPGKFLNIEPLRLFFIRATQYWCHNLTPEEAAVAVRGGVDPLVERNEGFYFAYFRAVLPLMNSDKFAKTFNCKAGSRMNPVKKCTEMFSKV